MKDILWHIVAHSVTNTTVIFSKRWHSRSPALRILYFKQRVSCINNISSARSPLLRQNPKAKTLIRAITSSNIIWSSSETPHILELFVVSLSKVSCGFAERFAISSSHIQHTYSITAYGHER